MIRLGLRLTVSGGREAALRLVMIAVAVAVGVGLLLTTLASLNAVNAQNARYGWLETGYASTARDATAPASGTDPLWWRLRADYFRGRQIGRVDLAATGAHSPVPPGIPALPGPGQFYASPALAKLLRDNPAAELRDRFPGTQIGTIGAAALPAPNSLIIVVGRRTDELSQDGHARLVTSISTTSPGNCSGDCVIGVGINSKGITLILSVVIAGLLFPVLIFIGGATRLSAARREQRFAAMRLIGATPRQISVISTVESSLAAAIGVVAGFTLFYAIRSSVAAIPFTGDPFFAGDLSLGPLDVLSVALGIPVAAAVAARLALRRVTISPLGVSRRVTPRPPRARRITVLALGLGELGYFAYLHDIGVNSTADVNAQVMAFLSGILLTMTGLVIAGPWLTMVASRLLVSRANRPATLIAGRRLADNPAAGFRAISGLVLAVFVGSCALGVITTIVAYDGGAAHSTSETRGTLVEQLPPGPHTQVAPRAVAAAAHRLSAVAGVTGVAVVHLLPGAAPIREGQGFAPPPDVVSCRDLAGVPALGHCPHGADTVMIDEDYGAAIVFRSHVPMADTTWPAAPRSSAAISALPVSTIAVGTDGSAAAVERARTVLDDAAFETFGPQTLSEFRTNGARELNSYKQLADVIILTSLPIAGCSLAVSVAGGLAERKRPFSLLRLTGTPLRTLRRVITLEAAAPLVVSALVSSATGLLTAHLFLRAQLDETLEAPSAQYYATVVAGLVLSLLVIASTLPLLNRMTGPETARNE